MHGVETEGRVRKGKDWEGTIHEVDGEGKARDEGEGVVEGKVHDGEGAQEGSVCGVAAVEVGGGLAKLQERAHCHHPPGGDPSG